MSRAVNKTSPARVDLREAAFYLDEQTFGLGDRFLIATERAFEQLAETPGLGAVRRFDDPRFTGLRSWRIRGFENWLVFYRVTEEAVEVVRVLHGARDVDTVLDENGSV